MGSSMEHDSADPLRNISTRELPSRLFAVGEEPIGIRVTAYQKSRYIPAILNSLSVDEIEFLQNSPFGKLISLAEEPTFSGRFGRFLMSRQLKTKKKHETWFLFAGVPVRFSLREFAIVTGLPCGKYPKKPKKRMRSNISETPYWPSLFGKLENVPVNSVIRMLKKRTVTDRETRIKYACLAILSSVLLPSSHYPKISKEHAELIKDLDAFFAYPWGRLSFDMLMSSIKERNEISLSQDTVSVPGFGLAIQLLLTEAVPALLEVVEEGIKESSESDGEEDDEEENGGNSAVTITLHPGHARNLDTKASTPVQSIIGGEMDEGTFDWSDEDEDPKVQTLLDLIKAGTTFKKEMFTGGATKADVQRMREIAKAKKLMEEKQSKRMKKQTTTVSGQPEGYATEVASVVVGEMKSELSKLEDRLKSSCLSSVHVRNAVQQVERNLEIKISEKIAISEAAIIKTLKRFIVHNAYQSTKQSVVEGNITSEYSPDQPEALAPTVNLPPTGDTNIVGENQNEAPPTGNENIRNEPRTNDGNEFTASTIENPPVTCKGKNQVGEIGNDGDNIDSNQNDPSLNEGQGNPEIDLSIPSFSLQITQAERDLALQEMEGNLPNDSNGRTSTEGPLAGLATNDAEADFLMPSFSIGMTQEEREIEIRKFHLERAVLGSTGHLVDNSVMIEKYRKLLIEQHYPFAIKMGQETVFVKEICEIGERRSYLSPKMMDVLMQYTKTLFTGSVTPIGFFDSKFVSILSRNYAKFKNLKRKGVHQFGAELLSYFNGVNYCGPDPNRFYFPFTLDRKHWLGLCVDFTDGVLIVLDSNVIIRSDREISKEFAPIAQMFPYLLRQSGRTLTMRELKPLTIQRPRSVPQNPIQTDSGVTAALLIQGHVIGGAEVCNSITPEMVRKESQKLAVMVYEEYHKML